MEDSKAMATPMSTTRALDADEEGEHVDQKEYRSMIGSLLYLRATRPDSSQYVCALVFRRLQGIRIGKRSSAYLGTCVTLPTSTFGTLRLLLWRFMVFQMQILPGVGWIGSPLLGLAGFLGSSLVSWSSRKHSSVAQSTTEAEYLAAASCCS
jgi:hypothetical protein